MGYTISFQGHKGWPAILGMAAAAIGLLTPFVNVLPYHAQVVIGAIGVLVSGFSKAPGQPSASSVTVDPNTPGNVVTTVHS